MSTTKVKTMPRRNPPDWRDVLTAVNALTQEGRGWLSLRMIADKIGRTALPACGTAAAELGAIAVRQPAAVVWRGRIPAHPAAVDDPQEARHGTRR